MGPNFLSACHSAQLCFLHNFGTYLQFFGRSGQLKKFWESEHDNWGARRKPILTWLKLMIISGGRQFRFLSWKFNELMSKLRNKASMQRVFGKNYYCERRNFTEVFFTEVWSKCMYSYKSPRHPKHLGINLKLCL